MNGTEAKRACQKKIIGTHDGTFHCDEVLACWMLKQLQEYRDSEILRTRKPDELSSCDIVVDVGAEYNHTTNRYDHHQRSFTGTMNSIAGKKWTTKLSSAGLVYLHFGNSLLSQLSSDSSEKDIEILFEKMYENFIEEVDAIDNGVDQYDREPRYQISTNLSSRVGSLNPSWNETGVDTQKRFAKAMDLVGNEFMDKLNYFSKSWLPAKACVDSSITNRLKVHESGEIIIVEGGCPWKSHLFTIEEEQGIPGLIKFALYKEDNSEKWRVQTVPDRLGSFGFRIGLKESWRGLRDDVLSKESGIPGGVFVHTSGFIGGNHSYDGALQMALQSIQAAKLSMTDE